MITIKIKEFSTWISVAIFEQHLIHNDCPRVRTASSLSHFRTIMREEQAHLRACGHEVRIERENMGNFGSLRLCEIA
jgi:hypothetical protein